MPHGTQHLTLKRSINAPPAEVYRMFTHPVALRDWLCDWAEADPRQGGRFFAWWERGFYTIGTYTAVEPGRKVALTWFDPDMPEATRVQVALSAKGDGALLKLTHAGVGRGAKWAKAIHAVQEGWAASLENLQSMMETGVDLRTARLPRMGIGIDDFNAEIAARLGVPVKAGIRLAGVAEGSGAQAAGLQKDDVLIALGGKKIVDYPTLSKALEGRSAGDRVTVAFYRGGAKRSVTMELSKRPQLEILPQTDLVATVQKNYAEIDAGFATLVEGVSEVEAGHRPAADAWSLKDTIAHFILTERDLQSWFAQMINDRAIGESLEFRPNANPRVYALVERLQTTAALLDELKRAESETVRLLANLPAELVARKHVYRRIVGWMTQEVPSHYFDEHLGLMQAAIASARGK